MMRRREFIAGAASLVAVSHAAAQQSVKPQRLAIFSPLESAQEMQENIGHGGYSAFFAELRRRGWTEGTNLVIERYGKEQNTGDLDALAAAVARSQPDCHVIRASEPSRACESSENAAFLAFGETGSFRSPIASHTGSTQVI